MNLIKTIKRRIYPTASKYFSRALLVEGVLKNTGVPLKCLLVDNSLFTEYLLAEMFREPVRTVRKWKMWIPALKNLPGGMDLCIAVLPRNHEARFDGLCSFKSMEWIRQVLDISGDWDDIRKRFHTRKRQIANSLPRRYGCRISSDPGDFDLFYHRMYLPHAKKQFGTLSRINSYEYLKKIFDGGFLILVTEDGSPVAGSLCAIRDAALIFSDMGVCYHTHRLPKRDDQSALYYFMIRCAKERGLRSVNFMKSRPFFNDGVYRHKREWGAAVRPDDDSKPWIYFFIPRYTEGAVSFFESNPAIVYTEDGLKGVVGVSGSTDISPDARKKLLKQFHAPGLESLLLLSQHSPAPVEVSFRELRADA